MNEAVRSYPKLNENVEDVLFGPIWMELLLFDQSWFSLEVIQIFPIYGNISNFTQIWMKLSQFAQISLRLLNLPKWF